MKYFNYIGTTDVAPINEQIELYPEIWNEFSLRRLNPNSPHADASDCWVRYNAWENFDPERPYAFNDEHVPAFYPTWYKLTSIHQLVYNLMWACKATALGGILMTSIPPGKAIKPHRDTGWHVEHFDTKLHVVLKSNDKCIFTCEDEQVTMKEGEIWQVENRVIHSHVNDGDSPRRTLIVCMRTT